MRILPKTHGYNNGANVVVFVPKMFSHASFSLESKTRVKKISNIGIYAIAIFVVFFLSWSVIAPIESSINAMGVILPDIYRQEVQAVDGGKIKKILVKNGDLVEKNQVLISLDATVVRNNIEMTREQITFIQINEFFLNAELRMYPNPDLSNISILIDNEVTRRYLVSSQMLSRNKVNILFEYLGSLERNKVATLAEKSELLKQQDILEKNKDVAVKNLLKQEKLYAQNFVSQISVERAEQELSGIESRISNTNISLHQNGQKLANIETEESKFISQFKNEAIRELKVLESSKQELEYRIDNLNESLEAKFIKAPVKGIVSSLVFNTINGVIPSGTKVMEIVPVENKHIIEAYISPKDIHDLLIARQKKENIEEYGDLRGIKAKLRFVGVNNRKVGMTKGIVTYVSQNTVVDPRTGGSFYVVKICIPDEELTKMGNNFQIYDGMQVAVYLKKGARTLFALLMEPILGFSDHALI